jgi:hypothetical protein
MSEERLGPEMRAPLTMLTIYAHPTDYPEGFVLRRWYVGTAAPGQEPAPVPSAVSYKCPSLEAAREMAVRMGGSIPLPRMPGDAPCIVETWV